MTMIALLGLTSAALACRGRKGTHPEDMSAKAHDAAAANAEAQAVEHGGQYDPDLVVYEPNCSKLCFRGNPTDPHRQRANQLRREAKRHRDASHELRVAEARACADIPVLAPTQPMPTIPILMGHGRRKTRAHVLLLRSRG